MVVEIILAVCVLALGALCVYIRATRRQKAPVEIVIPASALPPLSHTDTSAEREIDQRVERIHQRAKERNVRLYDDLERLTTGLGGRE
jgi:hypothetical protein